MERIRILNGRLRVLFRREAVIKDIDDEMRVHVEMETENYIARGMDPEDARRLAIRNFGNYPQMKDIGFERRGGGLMDRLKQDFKYGIRSLVKARSFTLIAAMTLALGIGATTAVFSLVQGVLLTPPPYEHPDRLALIAPVKTENQQRVMNRGWSAEQWMEWQKETKSFEAIAAYQWTFNFLVLQDGSESLEGMVVTKDYFSTVGLRPILGRTFVDAEDGKTPSPTIILSYDLWQRKFGGDQAIIGKTVRLSRQNPTTVIGVMPPGIRFLPSAGASQEPNYNVNALVDFWIPVLVNPQRLKNPSWDLVVRLKPGTAVSEAQSELRVLTAREAQADHDSEGITAQVQPLKEFLNADGQKILFPLFGAAGLVLLIACGNAAALLLVRGLQRQQEYAVRSALGAGRITLFRQVSTESLLLAILGGAFGVALALGIVRVFKLIGTHAIPRLDAVSTGWPVLASGLIAALVVAFLAGLFPALRASRLDPMQVIKSDGPSSSAGRGERNLLRGVVVTQTALTLALLVAAGLLIRTMNNLANVQTGYETGRILTMTVTEMDRAKWQDFHTQALERVAKLPGVQNVAFAWGVPLTGNSWTGTAFIEGQPAPTKPSDQLTFPLRAITEDYFNLLGLPVLQGRAFRATDKGDKLNVAIVNQSFVDRYFPNAASVGKKLWLFSQDQPPAEIVGVVANTRTNDLTKSAEPEIYLSLWQANAFSKHLVVRTSADPKSMISAVQRELRAIDPTTAIENIKTLEQIRNDSTASKTFATRLLVGFSVVASILTLVGIYGVLSLSVAARRREIAIRSAVGAQKRDILNLILGEGLRLIAGGVSIGLLTAILLSWVLSSLLFGVGRNDPLTLIGAGLLFTVVALVACWLPARRAAKVDPMVALRYE